MKFVELCLRISVIRNLESGFLALMIVPLNRKKRRLKLQRIPLRGLLFRLDSKCTHELMYESRQ